MANKKIKSKSGCAETDKSKLNRKRVIELFEKRVNRVEELRNLRYKFL